MSRSVGCLWWHNPQDNDLVACQICSDMLIKNKKDTEQDKLSSQDYVEIVKSRIWFAWEREQNKRFANKRLSQFAFDAKKTAENKIMSRKHLIALCKWLIKEVLYLHWLVRKQNENKNKNNSNCKKDNSLWREYQNIL